MELIYEWFNILVNHYDQRPVYRQRGLVCYCNIKNIYNELWCPDILNEIYKKQYQFHIDGLCIHIYKRDRCPTQSDTLDN